MGGQHDKLNCRLLLGTSVSPDLAVRVKLRDILPTLCLVLKKVDNVIT
jgi:hypothetical protein